MIDQRSVLINLGTKLKTLLQKDHVIDLQVRRKGIGHAKDHQIVDTSHMFVSGHEARVLREIGTGQEAGVQEEDLEVEVPERVGHGAEVHEETKTDHGAEVLKGRDLEAKVQEGTEIKMITNRQKKSIFL